MQEYQILQEIIQVLANTPNSETALRAVLLLLQQHLGISRCGIYLSSSFDGVFCLSEWQLLDVYSVFNEKKDASSVVILTDQLKVFQGALLKTKHIWFGMEFKFENQNYGWILLEKPTELIMEVRQEVKFIELLTKTIYPTIRYFCGTRGKADKEIGNDIHFIGNSVPFWELRKKITEQFFKLHPLLLIGEAGCGKYTVVKFLHQYGAFGRGPLIDFLPESKSENEIMVSLLGQNEQIGVIEKAQDGIVFIRNIENMSFILQGIFYQILISKSFSRIGQNSQIKLKARLIFGAHHNLDFLIKKGMIRGDLAQLLSENLFYIPSLQERGKADILLLVDYFVQFYAKKYHKKVLRVDTPTIDMLSAYHWPGNIRELENVIERAVIRTSDDTIHGHQMPPSLQLRCYNTQENDKPDFLTLVQNYEVELITEALKESGGNQRKAAEILGITQRMIQYKIQNYKIDYKKFH